MGGVIRSAAGWGWKLQRAEKGKAGAIWNEEM